MLNRFYCTLAVITGLIFLSVGLLLHNPFFIEHPLLILLMGTLISGTLLITFLLSFKERAIHHILHYFSEKIKATNSMQSTFDCSEISMALVSLQQVKNALKESQERYEVAVKGSSVGLWDWHMSTNRLYWSPRFKSIVGIRDEEFVPHFKEFENRLHPEDHARVIQAVNAHLNDKERYDIEYRLKHNQGHYVWIHARGQAIWNEEEIPQRMAGSVDDISEKKQIEQQLKEASQRYQLVLSATRDGIWDWPDISQDEEYWSPQWKRLLGYEVNEIEARASTFFNLLHPDDVDFVKKMMDKHVAQGATFDIEYRLKTKSSGYKWFESKSIITTDEKTGIKRMTGSITDINKRKEAESALEESEYTRQSFIEASYDGYWDWHIQEDYEYMSPRFWSMFGYNAHEKRHHPSEWQKIIFEDDLKVILDNFNKHVETKGLHPFSQEVRYTHKNGNSVYVLCRGKVIEWDEHGKPVRMIGTHRNITEKKKSIERLEQINKELNNFTSIASHNLKGPLRDIHDCSCSLLEAYGEKLGAEGKAKLKTLQQLCQYMEKLLNRPTSASTPQKSHSI